MQNLSLNYHGTGKGFLKYRNWPLHSQISTRTQPVVLVTTNRHYPPLSSFLQAQQILLPSTPALKYFWSSLRIYTFWKPEPGATMLDHVLIRANEWDCPTTELMGGLRFPKLNLLRDSQHRIKPILHHSSAQQQTSEEMFSCRSCSVWAASPLPPLGHKTKGAFFSEYCFEVAQVQLFGSPFKMKAASK